MSALPRLRRRFVAIPRHADRWVRGSVLVVDDVMTSGATLIAATKALQNAGNCDVYTSVLARVDKRL